LQHQHRVIKDILRSSVLLFGGGSQNDESVMEPYVASFRELCFNNSGRFLSDCRAADISQLGWFLYRARSRDTETYLLLMNRILHPELADRCSPDDACRILSTFSLAFAVVSEDDEGDKLADVVEFRSMLSELFEKFGVLLLASAELSPVGISSVIYAFAKANYVGNLGVFDELVDVMASRIEDFDARQIAQCLWACGKMITWVTDDLDAPKKNCENFDDKIVNVPQPPYVDSALVMATELARRSDELSTKDVTQALWASGHLLRGRNSDIITRLARRAVDLSTQLNNREISTIIFSLGKLNSKDYDVVYKLTRRFVDPCTVGQINSQECANVLYGLGRLNVRYDAVFENLTDIIREQIDTTSPQSIANCLWAHRAVLLTPPRQLLDKWATLKLGLNAVQPVTES